jgi:threonine efflux protein
MLQTALRSRRAGVIAAAGIWPAGAIWAFLGLAGVGALIEQAPALAMALRIGGGVYLCWLGWRMISASLRPRAAAGARPAPESALGLFAQGFLTNFLNPKAIAYYTSVFAATGAYELTQPWRAFVIVAMPGIGFVWYVFLTFVVSSGMAQRGLSRAGFWIDRLAGATMILFGVKLLAMR